MERFRLEERRDLLGRNGASRGAVVAECGDGRFIFVVEDGLGERSCGGDCLEEQVPPENIHLFSGSLVTILSTLISLVRREVGHRLSGEEGSIVETLADRFDVAACTLPVLVRSRSPVNPLRDI